MQTARPGRNDPILWCALIAIAFGLLAWHRLDIPSKIYFDEVHYVKAARKLLLLERANAEHPMVGKEIIAASIWLLGDRPINWRIPSLIFGTVGLFAFGRLMWLASYRRFATLAGMLLLATDFAWFIQSRIGMLDMFMAGFGLIGLWQFAAACRASRVPAARLHLAISGVSLGLALGAKWSIAPAAALPGLAFLVMRARTHGRHLFDRSDSGPVRGISLTEAALWLGTVPLAVYWLTYMPAFFWKVGTPIDWRDPVGWHAQMLALQNSVKKLHPYRSYWYQWIIDYRSVWYLYEQVDGAWRGIVLVGNPFAMWTGLAAFFWCAWAAWKEKRTDALAFALLYFLSLAMWFANGKPIQFYYHYLVPGTFLMGCLALALDDVWNQQDRSRWAAPAVVVAALAVFAWFYPIISAAALYKGRASYTEWMWLHSWR
jgi:dolichyl-phosphate-mannose--protein O-mannosyl transferase